MKSNNQRKKDSGPIANKPIFRNGNSLDIRRENVLLGTPSQASMWRLIQNSLESGDGFDVLMTVAKKDFANDEDFLQELSHHFNSNRTKVIERRKRNLAPYMDGEVIAMVSWRIEVHPENGWYRCKVCGAVAEMATVPMAVSICGDDAATESATDFYCGNCADFPGEDSPRVDACGPASKMGSQ
jgi:hypothetical protein